MTDTITVVDGPDVAASREWWKSAVVYQVYPRSFADSDGDGIGDLPGILQHVDHFVELGVDVVWLSPIYPSGGADNGYDITDYRAIDPVFGSMADFDALVEAFHARGIRLVMDIVVNHTSDQHPWFIESASSIDSSKRDWYWWRPPRSGFGAGEQGAEPTNWESFFSGPTWSLDPKSDEFYLHLFSSRQPDLNWENPDVRDAVYDMMRWWLDRGVDGFRMDVINLISKDPALPDGPKRPGELYGDGFAHYGYGPRIHEYLHELHEHVFSDRTGHFVTVGEMPGVTVEQAALFTDPARGELDMVFQFEHVSLDQGESGKWEEKQLDVHSLRQSLVRWQNGLAESGWNSLYWNNHDQPRVVSRFGDDGRYWRESATALAAVLHLQRGTPYIYQGEELGMTNADFTGLGDIRDIESLNHFSEAVNIHRRDRSEVFDGIRRMGRDNARTPMQWTSEASAGFSTGTPWIAVNANRASINAAAQRGVENSVFEFYRQLIRLRHTEPAIAYGEFRVIEGQHPSVFAFERCLADTRVLLIANLGPEEIRTSSLGDEWQSSGVLLANYSAPDVRLLRPWEAQVRCIRL